MYDLIVIGSGPGGYIAAIRAAQLGMKVACVERYPTFGGTCLNVGCIPSKAMLVSSEHYEEARHGFEAHGIEVDSVKLNLDKMLERKNSVVRQLTDGVAYLFKKNKIEGIQGHATITGKNTVNVELNGETKSIEGKRILLATGSKPSTLPGVNFDKEYIVDSTAALEFAEVPKHLVIIGAGVIGLEMGSVWRRLGAEVTVIEYLPKILGYSDNELAKEALKIFKKQGMKFILQAKVTGATAADGGVTVEYEDKNGDAQSIDASRLLVAVGRKPYTHNLGLESVGIELNRRGQIEVNHDFQTSADTIYAIGDVIPGPMLAHKAEEEGVVCVERMHGIGAHINYDAIPDVVYTEPEIASVGKTEEQLKEAGIEFKKGKFPFVANGRAKALNSTQGFTKILADAKTDRILGAQIIGPRAGDLIAELTVAVEFGASAEDLARTSHAHPTLAEVIKEAALAVDGRTLNM